MALKVSRLKNRLLWPVIAHEIDQGNKNNTMKKKYIYLILIACCGIQISLSGQFSPEPASDHTLKGYELPVSTWTAAPSYTQWEQAYNSYFKTYADYWFDNISPPYAVQVQNELGAPIARVKISLIDEQGEVENYVYTGIDGKALLWPKHKQHAYALRANYKTLAKQLKKPKPAASAENTMVLKHTCQQLEGADILALVDATHSMSDEFEGIMHALQGIETSVMLGRDAGERYLIKPVDLANLQHFSNQAAGGGKHEESIEQVLMAALQEHQWDTTAASRILLFFTDALPQRSEHAASVLGEAIQYANRNDVRIYPVAASGLNEEGEFLLQSLAMYTGGSYSWLNDSPGNIASHRIPLLAGDAQRTDLAAWLQVIAEQNKYFSNCSEAQQEIPGRPAEEVYCLPNPASVQTNIHFPTEVQSVIIYNMEGKIQGQWERLNHHIFSISVEDWAAGVYRIQGQSDKQQYYARLVVAR
jgi:hypothetical protein